jgi:hypothetical protein
MINDILGFDMPENVVLPDGRVVDPLTALALKHGTDKATHRYTSVYEKLFRPWRETAGKVLEIGIDFGNSLRMWQEYFTKAEIHGIDIHTRCNDFQTDRIKIHIGEQQDVDFLDKVIAAGFDKTIYTDCVTLSDGRTLDLKKAGNLPEEIPGPFDIIIDDGSHDSNHQIDSFMRLFRYGLSANGLYIIEDLHDAAFYGRPDGDYLKHHALRTLKQFVDCVNFIPDGWAPPQWASDNQKAPNWLAKNIVSITFYRFFCVIQKGNNEESSR